MKTGLGGSIRYRTTTGIALTAALTLPLVLAGCEDHSPVAAPTSTLPAKDASTPPPSSDPPASIPQYETDLDLNPEETEAVEGALVALDGYVETLNRLFASGGSETELNEQFASGDALKALRDDSRDLRKQSQYMAGEFRLQNRTIYEIASDRSQVSILSCVDNAAFAQVDRGEKLPDAAPEPLTVEFVAEAAGHVWKVQSQNLWSEHCAA